MLKQRYDVGECFVERRSIGSRGILQKLPLSIENCMSHLVGYDVVREAGVHGLPRQRLSAILQRSGKVSEKHGAQGRIIERIRLLERVRQDQQARVERMIFTPARHRAPTHRTAEGILKAGDCLAGHGVDDLLMTSRVRLARLQPIADQHGRMIEVDRLIENLVAGIEIDHRQAVPHGPWLQGLVRDLNCHEIVELPAGARVESVDAKRPVGRRSIRTGRGFHNYPLRCRAPLPSGARRSRRSGFRIDLRGEREIGGIDVQASQDRFPVLCDIAWNLVAHDGKLIRVARAEQCRIFNRREHLGAYLLLAPVLGAAEKFYGFRYVDASHQFTAGMLVGKAHRVASFMPHHAMKFGVRRIHREAFEVHRRLVRRDAQDVGTEVRPKAARMGSGGSTARDANLRIHVRFHEKHVGGLVPRIHVGEDASAQIGGGIVHESDGQMDAGRSQKFLVRRASWLGLGVKPSAARCAA